jgi:hypothetical protein
MVVFFYSNAVVDVVFGCGKWGERHSGGGRSGVRGVRGDPRSQTDIVDHGRHSTAIISEAWTMAPVQSGCLAMASSRAFFVSSY